VSQLAPLILSALEAEGSAAAAVVSSHR
jgi:hypothetical protein